MIAAMFPRRGPISLTFLIALSLPLQAAHPLDPLSREEIAATREVLRSAGKLHETTRFASIDAIRAFAGDDVEAAHVAPFARTLLSRYDSRCSHHDIVVEDRRA